LRLRPTQTGRADRASQTASATCRSRWDCNAKWGEADNDEGWAFIEIAPQVISVLDYRKGFGNTERVALAQAAESPRGRR
jgi:hypothetical protein